MWSPRLSGHLAVKMRTVALYPAPADPQALADLFWSCVWHLRGFMQSGGVVRIPWPGDSAMPPRPAWCGVFKSDFIPEIINQPALAAARAADMIICHDRSKIHQAPGWLARKAVSADEYLDHGAPALLQNAAVKYLAPAKKTDLESATAFTAQCNQARVRFDQVAIIGSGPSVHDALALVPKRRTLFIYCGNAVLDTRLTRQYPPNYIVAADAAAQFGPSKTAERFRAATEPWLEKNVHIIMPRASAFVMRAWVPPSASEKIHGVSSRWNRAPHLALASEFSFAPTGNILTGLALPLAASFKLPIYLAGFDGAFAACDEADKHTDWDYDGARRRMRHITPMLAAHPGCVHPDLAAYHARHRVLCAQSLSALARGGTKVFRPANGKAWQIAEITAQNGVRARRARWLAWTHKGYQIVDKLLNLPLWVSGISTSTLALASLILWTNSQQFAAALCAALSVIGLNFMSVQYLRRRIKAQADETQRKLAAAQHRQFEAILARLSED